MATIGELVALLESATRRLNAEAAQARKSGGPVESLRGQADAFLLLAQELGEQRDPAGLLEALFDMERIALYTARLDEEQASEFEAQGNASASRYHTKSARYTRGLVEGYARARVLLGTWTPGEEGAAGKDQGGP